MEDLNIGGQEAVILFSLHPGFASQSVDSDVGMEPNPFITFTQFCIELMLWLLN